MKPPETTDAFHALVEAGRLLDLSGRPLRFTECEWCGGQTVGSTCPLSVPCPICKAKPKTNCRRPSEHVMSTSFADVHKARRRAAEVIDQDREDNGDETVPRRWEEQ